MKLFEKKEPETPTPTCLFKKHGIKSGTIKVIGLDYWENLRKIHITFHVSADGCNQSFSTCVQFVASQKELLDKAFNNISKELDNWLEVSKEFGNIKKELCGKVVVEWQKDI